jgi:isoquinoline 1-oxidoreductase alpha subunit
MIMNGYALLSRHSAPTRQQTVQAMEGNICRCGTYQRILAAIDQAAETQRAGAAKRAER